MNMTSITRSLPLILVFSLTLLACDAPIAPASELNKNPAPVGKPGAPVLMDFQLPPVVAEQQLVQIALSFQTTTPAGSMVVRLSTDPQLQLVGNEELSFMLPLTTASENISLQTSETGLFYLHVSVNEFDLDGNPPAGTELCRAGAGGASN